MTNFINADWTLIFAGSKRLVVPADEAVCMKKIVLFIDKDVGLKFLKFIDKEKSFSATVTAVFSENLNIMNYCSMAGLPWYASDHDMVANLEKFDLIFSVQYPFIIQKSIIDKAGTGAYNLHFSLLPKNRGMYPLTWVILNKEQYHGITLHKLIERIDAGNIILQEKIRIGNMTAKQLYNECVKTGLLMLTKNFDMLIKGKIKGKAQDERAATYHDKFSIHFCHDKYLDAGKLPKEKLELLKRAFYFPPTQVPIIIRKGIKGRD